MALMALMALNKANGTILKNGTHGTIVFPFKTGNIYIVNLHASFNSAISAMSDFLMALLKKHI